jgi:hypothetical protein
MVNKTFLLMSKSYLPFLALVCLLNTPAKSQRTGEDLIKKMYARYSGKWYHSLTFNQTTEFYSNDSLKGTQLWYEAIVFPDLFRIDFGAKDSGNAAIITTDSTYIFRKGKLARVRTNDNDLPFLLGGLYFYPLDKSIQRLKSLGYPLDQIHSDQWKGKPVWVIGDTTAGKHANQLWIDQENLYLVRMLEFNASRKEEGIFENHIPLEGGWTETRATFYFNDKLVQVETYHNCVANKPPDPKIFDPAHFVSAQ